MKKLAIIGTREFAQQIRNYAENTGDFEVVGYVDDLEPVGSVIEGLPVLCDVQGALSKYNQKMFDCVFIAIGYSKFEIKENIYESLKGKIPFANIIAKTAIISPLAKIGEGVLINDYCTIDKNTIVEDNVVILGQTLLTHDCHIGKHSYLSGNNSIAGFVDIKERNFIGLGVAIADHITICSDCWIGIGCVVAQDILKPGKYLSRSMTLIRM